MSALGMIRALTVAAPLALAAAAYGQMANSSPYFAVVTADDAMMRCGNEDNFYPIAKLAKAQVLRVDGEGGGWSRVGYPSGVPAFIPADSFQLDSGSKTGTVTKANKLKALNMTTGYKGSWAPVLEAPVAVGTKLTVMDSEAAADGRGNTAFKVVPPENARAYVPSAALRKATPEEVNAAASAKPMEPPKTAAAPPVTTNPAPEPTVIANKPQAKPVEPTVPGTNSAKPPAPATPPAHAQAKPSNSAAQYDKLEAAFEAVRKQPPDTAEFTELMSEFQSAIDKLDSSPASKSVKQRLSRRLDYLKLSSDIQAQRRKLLESQQGLSANDKLIKQRLAEVDRVRQYTLVGRLSTSTIYDGERLPRMYRVQTVGGPAPRTLAYLKPDEHLGIDAKLGQVVGVVGEAVVDPTLKINIITPSRVDTLEAAEATSPETAPKGEEAPKTEGSAKSETPTKPAANAGDINK